MKKTPKKMDLVNLLKWVRKWVKSGSWVQEWATMGRNHTFLPLSHPFWEINKTHSEPNPEGVGIVF